MQIYPLNDIADSPLRYVADDSETSEAEVMGWPKRMRIVQGRAPAEFESPCSGSDNDDDGEHGDNVCQQF